MEKRVRAAARPSSSSATHTHTALPLVDNFLQVLPPERSHSAAPAVSAIQRSAAAVRVASSVKPSRGVIVTETVKKAAYALSNSCLQLEQLVLDVADGQSAQNSCRTDASMSSRSASASGFFFTGVPGLDESPRNLHPTNGTGNSSGATTMPRSQSQPMSPSSPDLILQPKQEQSAVPSHLIQGMQSVEDADLWCGQMLSKHQLQAALASLDLSDDDDDDDDDDALHSLNFQNEHDDKDCRAVDATVDEPAAAFDAARIAVVEDLQLLLCSMQNAVDDQGRLLMSQAELHVAAEAEEDRLLVERADAEVSAIHELQRLESDDHTAMPSSANDDAASELQPAPSSNSASANAAPTSHVTAGLSFAVDCLGDEWAPAGETVQQQQERRLKRAGIMKIMELDNQLCAARQRHRIITRTLASANGHPASPSKRQTASSASSALFSDKDRRLQQRVQRVADLCKNIEAPQLVSALQFKEEERVAAILDNGAVPHFGYDDSQQQRLLDIDKELLRMAAPDVADDLIASFCMDRVSAPISSAFSGAKARADAEASRFLQHEHERRQEQARIKDVNAQLRSIMELERLTVDADAPHPELPPGCRLVPKSRDGSAPLVVVAAPSAIQELLLDIRRAESLGDPSAWAAARASSRPDSACSVLSAATAELDALLASRMKSSAGLHRFDLDCASASDTVNTSTSVSPDKENEATTHAAAAAGISSHSADYNARASSTRTPAVVELLAVTASSSRQSVGSTSFRRSSSATSLKPSTPLPLRAPPAPSAAQSLSSIASCANNRSSSRADVMHSVAKPPPPPPPAAALLAASGGVALRGKGWVSGISDGLGLSLSGVTSCMHHAVPVKDKS